MYGLPGSGKSTMVDNFSKINSGKTVVLSTDDYIEKKALDVGKEYSDIFKETYKEAENAMYEDLRVAILFGNNIIWDQTNLTVKSRAYKLGMIPSDYTKIAVCMVENDLEDLLYRQNHRLPKKVIPYGIMKSMKDNMETPSSFEGFDVVFFF